jgi:hypothetical protein
LRTEPIDSQVSTARLWRILYTSSDINGKTIAVSGLVAAPTAAAPSEGYPVVVVAHGTSGINQGCAPSIKPFGKVDDKNTAYDYLVGQYVRAGYAVVMADFEGLGVKGNNSYLVGEVEGRNVLDSARAIKSFPDFKVNPKMLLAGQSQAGTPRCGRANCNPATRPTSTSSAWSGRRRRLTSRRCFSASPARTLAAASCPCSSWPPTPTPSSTPT